MTDSLFNVIYLYVLSLLNNYKYGKTVIKISSWQRQTVHLALTSPNKHTQHLQLQSMFMKITPVHWWEWRAKTQTALSHVNNMSVVMDSLSSSVQDQKSTHTAYDVEFEWQHCHPLSTLQGPNTPPYHYAYDNEMSTRLSGRRRPLSRAQTVAAQRH